ncbi:MAG: peptide chain release factor 1, partial [Chloroflexi bacterium]|nr:peptide chain release factor 1 [Chloroflexota bacterium]
MFEQVEETVRRYDELSSLLASPEVAQDFDRVRVYAQEQSDLADVVNAYRRYKGIEAELESTRTMLGEEKAPEMRELIADEVKTLEAQLAESEALLKELLIPKDPRDQRNVMVEIRAGTGGDEAALFGGDLLRMYMLYAAARGWKTELLSANETGIGGYKEVILSVKGKGAYSRLKFESGVHRVQRVPTTESSGRIHTSTATVAVLPEVDDVDVKINETDLRIDVYRAGGHGGQGVNTTDSAVRITHLPTGIIAQCQDERSQLQNKARAMAILRARVYDVEFQKQFSELDETRRKQVGSAER